MKPIAARSNTTIRLLCAVLLLLLAPGARAEPPPLRHGVNLTGWFRFPASLAPDALRRWIGDDALADLHRAGFDFVRLAVDPAVLAAPPAVRVLDEAIGRMQRAGLAVVVALHPTGWHLEDDPSDRARLFAAWASLAPVLAAHDPRNTVAEPLNEPVFAGRVAEWQGLQHRLLLDLRRRLPRHPVLLSGNDWSSIAGLLAMTPEPDPEVLYGVHFYDPVELTSLAAWRPGLDRAGLARLPFPAADDPACHTAAADTDPETAGVIRYYCAQHWDPQRLAVPLAAAAAWGRAHGVRVLVGEFGATAALNPAARSAWLAAVREGAEHAGLGWALWGYDDVMGFAVRRPPGSHPVLDSAVLRALGLRVAP